MWDSAGQERFRAISSVFYRNAAAVIVVFDITERRSFNAIDMWLNEISDNVSKPVVGMLLGNKSDLRHIRTTSTKQAEKLARKHSMLYSETSAYDAMNVEESFLQLARQTVSEIEAAEMVADDADVALIRWKRGVRRRVSSSTESETPLLDSPSKTVNLVESKPSEKANSKESCCA